MAVHLSIGRITPISCSALIGLAVAVGAAYFLFRSAPEAETAAISRASAAVPSPTFPGSSARDLAPPLSRAGMAGQEAADPAAAQPPVPAEPREFAVSMSRPEIMAPIPTQSPRAAEAGSRARRIAKLFEKGVEINIDRDASVYITSRNIPENDRLLEAYRADIPSGGGARTSAGKATVAPGLLGIATQAQRYKWRDQANRTFTLADAMRDAIWRKKTAARLKAITTLQSACADGMAMRAPSIGLATGC